MTALLLAALLEAAVTPTARPIPTLTATPLVRPASGARLALFDYDASRPLDIRTRRASSMGGVQQIDFSYASPKGGRVPATLVVPPGSGPFAALVFVHPAGGTGSQRETFLSEATELARVQVVSLLIDAPFAREGADRVELFAFTDRDLDGIVQGVVDARRGLDLLLDRSDVDPKRVGFVGASYGATVGAILSGVERRFATFVLMSAGPKLTNYLRGLPEAEKLEQAGTLDAYLTRMEAVDPDQYVARPHGAQILFQWGNKDPNVPRGEADFLWEAASSPKERLFYEAGHELNEAARRQRAGWLARHLGLTSAAEQAY